MTTQRQTGHTKGKQATCTCRIDGLEQDQMRSGLEEPSIIYCPMHEAARELLEACRKAHSEISDNCVGGIDNPIARQLYYAISKAQEGRA